MSTKNWWLPKQPRYLPGATLYCDICETIVPVEANPKWEAAGRPFDAPRPSPAWFIRCPLCHQEFYQAVEGQCPECGAWPDLEGDTTIVRYGQRWEAGVPWDAHGHRWKETHRCSICGVEFIFTNADY